jgi:hypothetical protein
MDARESENAARLAFERLIDALDRTFRDSSTP